MKKLRQFIIFVLHQRQIRLFDGIIRRVIADNRFHRNRGKSVIEHIFYISSEIQILSGKSTADIVFFSIAMLNAVLEIFHDSVISTFIIHAGTHRVMHFFTAVQRQDQADVIYPSDTYLLLIQKHSVRRKRHLIFLLCFFSCWRT